MTNERTTAVLTLDLLERLDACWRRQGAPIVGYLRPGLDDEQMDASTAPLGLVLNGEARTWWGWHDGADHGRKALEGYLVGGGWSHLSLEEAVATTLEFRQFAEEAAGAQREMVWGWSWVALATDARGGALCVDCGVAGELSPMVMRGVDEGVRSARRVATLGQVVEWWIEGMDDGYVAFDRSTGYWRWDWERIPPDRLATRMV